jgi:hypothetical protein
LSPVSQPVSDGGKISLIATLFSSHTPPRRKSTDHGDADNRSIETDFMFALFIQQQVPIL